MDAPPPALTRRAASRRWAAVLLVLVSAACAVGVWQWRRHRTAAASDGDPRLTFSTPYRNVGLDVRYVGDAACTPCHADIAQTYAQHPMGRSLAPVADATPIERYDKDAGNPFEAFGLHHTAQRQGTRSIHKEARLSADGKPVAQTEAEVRFTVGSGAHGRSYLIERDGYLFQSSLTWYVEKKQWALSPRYEVAHQHFDRPVGAECLSCHANRLNAVAHTVNRYRQPIFDGFHIGCERCHGPGALHVESSDPLDIVNPAKLEPYLRDAVCEQCHLAGRGRILLHGRQYDDFRPGLPLHLFWAVFVKRDSSGDRKLVSHVEAMHESKCFQKSSGKMGCISCHDPHVKPAPEKRVAYYRDRCLACHGEAGCSLTLEERRGMGREDSCIDCHMTRINPADIAHATITDHSIPRRTPPPDEASDLSSPPLGGLPLLHFHRYLLTPEDRRVSREMGIMLSDVARQEMIPEYARLALPLLNRALEEHPDDVRAGEAKGCALWLEGRHAEALAALEKALAVSPDEETTLVNAATLAFRMGRHDDALAYWERALKINPWPSSYHYELARVHAARSQWDKAIAECRTALGRNIAHLDARRLLVECLLRNKDRAGAKTEFDLFLGFEPPHEDVLRQKFAELER
jgi:Flp pilus assembly protein TadD